MMKYILFYFFFANLNVFSQGTAGFFDDRGFFYTYMNGGISKQEILKIDTFFPSVNYVSYIDRNGNFKFIHNHQKYTIYPLRPDALQVTNYLMAYTQGLQLGVFNGRQSKKIETFIRGGFKMGDSIIAFVDNYDILKCYVYDTIYQLANYYSLDNVTVSDNMLLYISLDQRTKLFYNQSLSELEGTTLQDFKMARHIIAYNDNIDNFKVYDHGVKQILEPYHISEYSVSPEMVTYYNNVNEWTVYSNGEKITLLSTHPKTMLQKRNMLVYSDNAGNFYLFYKGKKTQLENYTPKVYDIWDDLLVYEDMYRVLWGVSNGEKIKISEGIVKGDWQLQKKSVVYYDLTPNTKTVWNNGKLYQYSESDDPNKK